MDALLQSLQAFLIAGWDVLVSLFWVLLPWTPLIAWIAFWMFTVNWINLRRVLVREGGWIGLVLIGLVMILVWGTVAPPAGGSHEILGLNVSNYVGKTVYVAGLFVIMFLAGAVQLSGCCASCCRFDEEQDVVELHDPAHAH